MWLSVALWLALLASGCVCPEANAQSNEWAWMSGPQTPQPAQYGTSGMPAATNLPGIRTWATGWTDSSGNLWLFGGYGPDSTGSYGSLNDLWEYSPAANEWTWMGGSTTMNAAAVYGTLGVAAAGNVPGSTAGAAAWTDTNGNVWVFGVNGNELWKFNPSTNEWAWMRARTTPLCSYAGCGPPGVYGTLGTAAAGNSPGARSNELSWTDNHGNFWLFGGSGYDSTGTSGFLNDLWEFNPSTMEWTWMGGSSTIPSCSYGSDCGQPGVYGAVGTPTAGNSPGGRYAASGWTDSKGNLWMFGGFGYDATATYGLLNDLWEFSPSTDLWTWMGGSNTIPATCNINLADECGAPGVYAPVGTPAPLNIPGARMGASSWTDSKGNLWLFGGDGIDSTGIWGYLDDFWVYSPSTNEWVWMSGSSTVLCAYVYCGQPGMYGTLQTAALGNTPSGRDYAVRWTDPKGIFWLFGGAGVNVVNTFGYSQDLWEFQPNTSGGLPITATPTFSPGSGTYATVQAVAIYDTTPGATIQYLLNGNAPALQYTAPISITSSETIEAIAGANGYANSDITTASYITNIPSAATPTFSPLSGTYATAQTVTISDATPGTTIYYTTDGTTPTTSSAVYTSPIAVSSSKTILAIAIADDYLNSALASAVYTIGSNSTLGEWAWMGGSTQEDQPGAYGTLGTPGAGNIPGARNQSTSWTDQTGNFWLFGGQGYDANDNYGYLNDLWEFNPSTRQWTWRRGASTVPCNPILGPGGCTSQPGVYGTLGTPAVGNVPGDRYGAMGWMDGSGHLWLFGGKGIDASATLSEMNDLWEYSPSTNEWAWMGGQSKGVNTFFNGNGFPAVYGTLGIPAPGNIPGGRYGAVTWTDSNGNFWLFGGTGQDSTNNIVSLNDLWEFNPTTMEWAWMGGSDLVDALGYQLPAYGTFGVPSAATNPGSLSSASSWTNTQGGAAWTDTSGNLWLFAGGTLWKYNPSLNEWAWMSGAGAAYCPVDPFIGYNVCTAQPAAYGALGLPAAGNYPGGGSAAASWTDRAGNLWFFGGSGADVTGQNSGFYRGSFNAMWVFSLATNAWAWMGGDYAASNCNFISLDPIPVVGCDGSQGVLGSQSTPGLGNIPPARTGAVSWTDKSGNFWLFSGQVMNLSDTQGDVNDLWEYQPSSSTLPPATTPIFSLKAGTYVTGGPLTISNGMANASIYYTTDGTTPTKSSNWYSGPITVSTSETIQAMATAPGYRNSGVASASYVVVVSTAPSTPAFSLASGSYTSVQRVSLSDSTPGTAIYYTTDGSMPDPSSPVFSGPITVASSETINALAAITVDYGYSVFDEIALYGGGYAISGVASATYVISLPPAATPMISVPSGTYFGAQTVTISDATAGATIYYTTDGTTPTTSSIPYTGLFVVYSTETIQAIAVASGYSSSAVASATYTIDKLVPDFSVAVSPSSLTIAAGQGGTATISVTPLNGFNSVVSFSCSGLLSGTSCSFSPATVTPSATAASTTLTLTASTSASNQLPAPIGYMPVATLAVTLCLARRRNRHWYSVWILCVAVALSLFCLSACGGGNSNSNSGTTPPPESGTVTVTATSGSLSHSATLAVSVN